jgi:EAL domain-containing protein (putative c-di-GMP-specific phosphodiesterase class I)
VEDASSLAVLWQCSVDFIQGHFLQQPTTELNFEFENAF